MSAEIIQFVPRSRPSLPSERLRNMIAQARAQYQAIFPDELAPSVLYPLRPASEAFEDTAPCELNPSPESLA